MRSHIIWEKSVAPFWTELISALRYRRFLFHSFTVEEREKIPLLSEKEWKKYRRSRKNGIKNEKINFNGQLKSSLIDKFCPLTDSASRLLARAFEKIAFSARSYHRILKVARTIADMEGEEMIAGHHIGEALSYRAFDKDSVIK